jgi:hypothetical protein
MLGQKVEQGIAVTFGPFTVFFSYLAVFDAFFGFFWYSFSRECAEFCDVLGESIT